MRVFYTSFIIDLSNSYSGALTLANSVDEEGSVAAISVISVHEFTLGIHLKYFKDREILSAKLESAEKLLSSFMILSLTKEIAMESARIEAMLTKKGAIIGSGNIFIAATAVVNKASVVTRNSAEFQRVEGLRVEEY